MSVCGGGAVRAQAVAEAVVVDACLGGDADVDESEKGGGNADVGDTAAVQACRQSDDIEHDTAADGDRGVGPPGGAHLVEGRGNPQDGVHVFVLLVAWQNEELVLHAPCLKVVSDLVAVQAIDRCVEDHQTGLARWRGAGGGQEIGVIWIQQVEAFHDVVGDGKVGPDLPALGRWHRCDHVVYPRWARFCEFSQVIEVRLRQYFSIERVRSARSEYMSGSHHVAPQTVAATEWSRDEAHRGGTDTQHLRKPMHCQPTYVWWCSSEH